MSDGANPYRWDPSKFGSGPIAYLELSLGAHRGSRGAALSSHLTDMGAVL